MTFAQWNATNLVSRLSFIAGRDGEPGAEFENTSIGNEWMGLWTVAHDAIHDELGGIEPENEADCERGAKAAADALEALRGSAAGRQAH